MDVRSLR